MTALLGLSADTHVIEIAANDGYLLQYVLARGIPCTGVEPTITLRQRRQGHSHRGGLFGLRLAQRWRPGQADLTAANNVLAHVPDINDFVAGFVLLKEHGVALSIPASAEIARRNPIRHHIP